MERGPKLAPGEEVVTLSRNGSHRQTYAQTRARACQLANALAAHGIVAGDRVTSFMWNGHRHLELYYAVPSMGAVLHTLNIRLAARELEYIVNHAGSRLIVADEDVLPLLEPLKGRIPSVERVVVCSDEGTWKTALPGNPGSPAATDYEDFLRGQPADYTWPEFDENSPLGLCYTSGTTGNPKGVMYTHRSEYLISIACSMTDVLELSAKDTLCSIVPMFHVMGWGLPFVATMLGAKQAMPHRFTDPVRLLDFMAAEKATFSAGVPVLWQGVRRAIEAEPDRWDLSALRRIACGGSAPPVSLIRWFQERLGVEMLQLWGMTETHTGTVSRSLGKHSHLDLPAERRFENVAKAGLPPAGIEVEILDAEGRPLAHDGEAVGEIAIRGPWVCAEYYRNPQPESFHDGWLLTGDVGSIDPEEYVVITDRSKDLVKSGGEWISSVDLENHIAGLPGVAQAAVVAQPHPKWDERPVVLIVRAEGSAGAALTPEAVLSGCATSFAKWQLPDDVIFCEAIPLTSTGKIDKKTIRARLEAEQYRLPDLRK
jgi:fatty-acyl-CoA synthase